MEALRQGREPQHAAASDGAAAVPTYGGDTVLRIPPAGDDRALLRKAGAEAMAIQFAAEGLAGEARDRQVIEALKALEATGPAA